MSKKIIIVAGDPNSINSEIICKTWKKINSGLRKKIYLIANFKLILNQFKKINANIQIIKVNNINDAPVSKKLKIIDIPLNFKNPFDVSLLNTKKYIIKSFNLAHNLSKDKFVKGLINCPINKKLLGDTKKIGVTEFLASKCKIKANSEAMLIYNKNLSVLPLTTHLKIRDISKKIDKKLIINKLRTLKKDFKRIFNKNPKIGVLGLNPHNAELIKNSEEKKEIIPAILKLKKEGFKIEGPLSADTVFINNYKNYDVIVGMYHDQVLAPFKSLFHFDAINITLGLKYVRVSPDHGPALDIVKKNKASYLSLLRCVKFINNIS